MCVRSVRTLVRVCMRVCIVRFHIQTHANATQRKNIYRSVWPRAAGPFGGTVHQNSQRLAHFCHH